jgi:hypothetical protein
MPRMTRSKFSALCLFSVACVAACSPALNWRQLSADSGRVQVLLPCKPEQATRQVSLRVGTQDVPAKVQLQGCEASGMQFTLAYMTVPEGMQLSAAMAAWRLASLAPLQLGGDKDQQGDWQLQGARADPTPIKTRVMTNKHQAQFVWFAHGQNIYQAAVYGNNLDKGLPEAAETYFSGIKLP